jgi:hypothetical protein
MRACGGSSTAPGFSTRDARNALACLGFRVSQLVTPATRLACFCPQVVQEVHVKNRCAWLNHSGDAGAFLRVLEAFPSGPRLWFSGHFHLSHNYADSVSPVGRCAFVQTGVIGKCNRDGFRHSRLLRGGSVLLSVCPAGHQLRNPYVQSLDPTLRALT